MKNKKMAAIIIRWIARIWGSCSLAFMLFFLGAHLIGSITSEGEEFNSQSEMVSFAFFPVSIIIGLIVAWKWEGVGGLITIAGIVGFHFLRPDLLFDPWISGLAAPGLFFILYWLISRGQTNALNSGCIDKGSGEELAL
ncbi:MAG: hypothetical protein IH598_13705 [Bacteroidales bacterium]|nr:hypothetical protein [Bacteroidales bacterium]